MHLWFMGLEKELKEIASLKEQDKSAAEKTSDAVLNLRRRIEKGETTGNVLDDYMLIHYGYPFNEEHKKAYQNLLSKLVPGNHILVSQSEGTYAQPGCFGGGGFRQQSKQYTFGVLKSEPYLRAVGDRTLPFGSLVISEPDKHSGLILPMDFYLKGGMSESNSLVEGNLELSPFFVHSYLIGNNVHLSSHAEVNQIAIEDKQHFKEHGIMHDVKTGRSLDDCSPRLILREYEMLVKKRGSTADAVQQPLIS